MSRTVSLTGENAIVAGETFYLTIFYPELDLSGWSLSAHIRKKPSAPLLAAFSFPTIVYGNNSIDGQPSQLGTTLIAKLTAAQTASLPIPKKRASSRDAFVIGKTAWCYDLEATSGDTIKIITLSPVEIVSEVTQ